MVGHDEWWVSEYFYIEQKFQVLKKNYEYTSGRSHCFNSIMI